MKKVVTFILALSLVFSVLAVSLADEVSPEAKEEFTIPSAVPAKEKKDFFGEWCFFLVLDEDGTETTREQMLADGIADDHAEITITETEIILYSVSLGDPMPMKYTFNPEDGSLTLLNGGDEPPVLRLNDNGMLSVFIPGNDSFCASTAYCIRKEP